MWQQHAALLRFLQQEWLFSCPSAAQQAQAAWTEAIAYDILLNPRHSELHIHMLRLSSVRAWALDALRLAAERVCAPSAVADRAAAASQALLQSAVFLSLGDRHSPEQRELLDGVFTALAVPYAGASNGDLCPGVQAAFEAVVAVLSASDGLVPPSSGAEMDESETSQRIWDLLKAPCKRCHSRELEDVWWGAFASVAHQLAARAHAAPKPDARGFNAVLRVLCREESATMLVQCLLANPETVEQGVKGVKAALSVAADFHEGPGCPPAVLVSACCELLAPEVNAAMATRLEALISKI